MTDSPLKLARCPCGEVPARLVIQLVDGMEWAFVSGSCCGDWWVECRADYKAPDSPKSRSLAAQAWNDAPRREL